MVVVQDKEALSAAVKAESQVLNVLGQNHQKHNLVIKHVTQMTTKDFHPLQGGKNWMVWEQKQVTQILQLKTCLIKMKMKLGKKTMKMS